MSDPRPGRRAVVPSGAALVSVQELHVVVPGPLDRRTGGYLYDARMVAGLRERGWTVRVQELDGEFPGGDDRARAALLRALERPASGSLVLVDGLALGGLPEAARAQADRLRLVGLVHHPLCDETGLAPAERERLRRTEREALAACRGVVCTSPFTGERLRRAFGVPAERLSVVEPGTESASPARGPGAGHPPSLVSVGAVIPRKGYDLLVSALARLPPLRWEWKVAGSLSADPGYVDHVRDLIRGHGLEDRVSLLDEVAPTRVASLLDGASLFVLPSHYEGYGMALTEALARGLPLLSTRGGAIPHTVPDGTGLLVPPGDPDALRSALAFLLGPGGEARREVLAERARCHARRLPGWEAAVDRFASALRELGARGSGGAPGGGIDA